MASIYGFKLKNIKTFPGRDWEGVTADLWYKGKKIALFADYGDGADGTIEYYNGLPGKEEYAPILDKTIKMLAEDERFDKDTRETLKKTDYFMGESIFIDELLDLTDKEKEYKKIQKKGFTCIAYYQQTDGMYYALRFASENDKGVAILKADTKVKRFKLYTSLEEFEIGEQG